MLGNSLAVQRLGLGALTARGPGRGTKIPQALQHGQKLKDKEKEMLAGLAHFSLQYQLVNSLGFAGHQSLMQLLHPAIVVREQPQTIRKQMSEAGSNKTLLMDTEI